MAKRYSTVDLEHNNIFYEGRIPEGAIPSVSQSVPEFFAGVELPESSQFVLSNLDNEITTLKNAGGFKRGKKVIISKGYGSINQGQVSLDPNETYVEYRGVIDSSPIGEQGIINMLPADIDVFDKEFPFEKVTTDLFSDAIDLDDDVPWIVGTAKQVPLSLILAQESPSELYEYLVGRGTLTVDEIYREGRALGEIAGTATATTTNSVTLAAGDQEADDYYNKKVIIMDGSSRLITNYVGSTNVATVAPGGAWTAGAYTIREYFTTTEVIDTVTYTKIQFYRRQRDTSESLYQRDSMSADVTGLTTERNPARFIETLLELFPDVALNSAGFTTAADDIDAVGNLFVDGALVTRRRVFDILNQVCHIGRLRLRLNDSGELYPVMDGTEGTIRGIYNYDDNIVSIGAADQQPLSQLWKTLELRYRLLFDEDDYRLTTAKHDVNAIEGRIDQGLDYDLVFDKTTADKLCDYLAKRKNSFDESISVTLNHEARGLELGQLINLNLNVPLKSGTYQIISKSLLAQGYEFTVIPYDAAVFTYVAGTLPTDPVTDSQADFRFTPAEAVDNLSVTTSALPKDFKSTAKLTWDNPTTNFTEVVVQYKKNADSLYTTAGVVSGGGDSIEIVIDAGTSYDYKVLSFNQFRDPLLLGVATLDNQTSAGTAATPSTPGTPTLTVNIRGFQAELSSYTKPSNFLRFETQYTDNSGTSVGGIFTHEGLIAPALIESGTGAVTRKAKTRAIGVQSDGTEVASSYSSLSSAASNEEILQAHILDDEITNVSRASISTESTIGPGGGDIIAATITPKGSKVLINASFTCRNNGGTPSSGGTVVLRRGTTTLRTQNSVHQGLTSSEFTQWEMSYMDTSPGSSSVSYNLINNGDTLDFKDRNISVEDLKR